MSLFQFKYVPSELTSKRFTQAWFTKACNSKVRRNKKLYIKTKRTNLTSDCNNFQEAATVARKTCKEAYNNFVSKAFSGTQTPDDFSHMLKPKYVRISG